MTVIVMSRNELSRLQVLIDVADRRLAVEDAASLMVGAVSLRRRLGSPDHIVSMIDGKPYRTLKSIAAVTS